MIKNINKGRLINGDCLDELKHCPDNSIDLIVTDPPYGLFYYGLKWDKELPNLGIWKECHRVLKPGGFAFIMSSVRQDVLSRLIISLELAGFNTQFSSLYWTYSTGFPKAANIGVAIDKKLGVQSKIVETKIQERVKFKHMRDLGMKGQFCDSAQIKYDVKEPSSELGKSLNGGYAGFQPKPAVEAVLVAMKPLAEKTYVAQAIANSKGVTFLDSCRIPSFDKEGNLKQRVMSNLIVGDNALDLNEKELGVEIECVNRTGKSFRFSLDAWAKSTLPHLMVEKPRLNEKDFGLENLQYDNLINRKPGQLSLNVPMKSRPSDRKNIHPTVKPLKLMSYLTVLGSRPGDLVLDPFCGSGTTCLAALLLGRKFVGIEIEKEYCNIAKERLSNITRVSKKEEQVADKSENTKRLDKIASITLRCLDNSVIDIKEVPAIINEAIGNLVAGKRRYGLFEIDTNLRGSDVEPEKATESTSASPSIYQKMMSGTKKRRTRRGKPKVISVSRRTDIPALYSDWFFNRVKEGVVLVKTKIDSPKITKVFLEPEDVRCFVFWTKNPGPMLARIDELDRYKYYFHFTLTPYGPDIEPNLPPKKELVETFIQLSKRIGKDRVIWRYDPIILTDTIDLEYHKQNFESMAKRLHKHTEKCVISFLKASKSALKAMGL